MSTAALTRCSSTPSTANGNLCRAGLARTPAVAVGARRRQFYLPQTKSTEPHRRPERCSSSRSLTICAVLPNSRNGHAVEKLKLAVLIDGENAQAAVIEPLLAEVAKYGTASVKRIYADWTKLQHRPWKPNLLKHSIQPIQQFSYTSGKNATDSALIIDAMDLLHSGTMDGFCLVSSDSDFTRLASRLREDGLLVIGFGERKTPVPFVHSCDKFVYTEVLRNRRDSSRGTNESSSDSRESSSCNGSSAADVRGSKLVPLTCSPWAREELLADSRLMWTLRTAIDDVTGEDGWANLGLVGSIASAVTPEFDCRNYGYKRLGQLLASMKPEVQMSGNRMFVRIDSSFDEYDDILPPEEQGEERKEEEAEEEVGGQSAENVLGTEVVAPWTREQLLDDSTLMWTLRTAIADVVGANGWANLGHVGKRASILTPDFDCHSYGYKRLGQLLANMGPEIKMSGTRMYVTLDSSLDEAAEAVQRVEQWVEEEDEDGDVEADLADDDYDDYDDYDEEDYDDDDDEDEELEEDEDGWGRSAADGQGSNVIALNGYQWTREQLFADSTLMWTLRTAIEDVAGEGGWANLGFVARIASTLTPDFDCRNYGYKRLGHLLTSMGPEVQMSENRNLVRIDSSFDEAEGIVQMKDQKEEDEQSGEDEDEDKGDRGQEATGKPDTEGIKAVTQAHDVKLNHNSTDTSEKVDTAEAESKQQGEETIEEEAIFYCI